MVLTNKIIFSRKVDTEIICVHTLTHLYTLTITEYNYEARVNRWNWDIVSKVVRTMSTHGSRENHPFDPFPLFFPLFPPSIELRIAFRVYNSDISTTVCSARYAFARFFAKSARHYMKRKIDINCCSWHSSSRAPQMLGSIARVVATV